MVSPVYIWQEVWQHVSRLFYHKAFQILKMSTINIKIDQGELQGSINVTEHGFKFHSFCGIPYAKPPIGNLRFKDPQPAEGWSGVRDATKEGAIQCQVDKMYSEQMIGHEDSLFINVHVPANIPPGTKLPVMVWIHGGSFQTGSGNSILYGPDYLLQHNIVFVSLNYRMGILGFLCLNNAEVPGNAGLKDQAMALKWVKNNIEKFGGDSKNVTIFGESAGGASVSYLMMSPMAKGLFEKAIMQSGVALNGWSLQKFPNETITVFAEKLGIKPKHKEELLQLLQSLPVERFFSIGGFSLLDDYNFVPVVEKEFPNVSSFITKPPLEIMLSGDYNKVPIMCGHNSQEGVLFASKEVMCNPNLLNCTHYEESGINVEKFIPITIKQMDTNKKNVIIQKVVNEYFSPLKKFFDGYLDLMTDAGFGVKINQAVKLMCKPKNKVYYYYFDYHGQLNMYAFVSPFKYTGAAHTDDLGYIFKPDVKKMLKTVYPEKFDKISIQPTEDDILLIRRFTEMWTNFAKFGDPIPETNSVLTTKWKPASEREMHCLKIGKQLEMIKNPLADRMKFWTDLERAMNG